MDHDPHKDDPLWVEFYRTQPPGVHSPREAQPPTTPRLPWEDRLETYLGRLWLVCLSLIGYLGLVVLAVMVATYVIGVFNP